MVWCSSVLTTTTLSVFLTLETLNSVSGFLSVVLYNTMPLIDLLKLYIYICGQRVKSKSSVK